MRAINLSKVETWAPHPVAMPVTAKTRGGRFVIKANGTRTCCGGWQFVFTGVRPGQGYRIRTSVRHENLDNPVDRTQAIVCWGEWEPNQTAPRGMAWNYLLPRAASRKSMDFE